MMVLSHFYLVISTVESNYSHLNSNDQLEPMDFLCMGEENIVNRFVKEGCF